MKRKMRQYNVKGLALQESSQNPYLILEDTIEGDTITIQIGPSEASSLLLSLTDTVSPVPQIHDVMAALIDQQHIHPEYLSITLLGNPESSAVLHYRKHMKHYRLKLTPADGIALAFRLEIPIYLTPEAIITGTIHNPLYFIDEDPDEAFLYVEDARQA